MRGGKRRSNTLDRTCSTPLLGLLPQLVTDLDVRSPSTEGERPIDEDDRGVVQNPFYEQASKRVSLAS